MIKIYDNPDRLLWADLTARCQKRESDIQAIVRQIIDDVRERGDEAVREISARVGDYAPEQMLVSQQAIADAAASISPELKAALNMAKANILAFHKAQLPAEVIVNTMTGVKCVQRAVPIQRVGLYIPGGKAPLFSTVLMLALPAKIAGCKSITLCTPANREGKIAPEILYAAQLCGIDRVYAVGGAQAIAAMAYGTTQIEKVDKIFGPGNRFVTIAKQMVGASAVAIDMPAGPSEVMVMADATANPAFVAADLLSQAEHAEDSQSVLICDNMDFAQAVNQHIEKQLSCLSRKSIIEQSLANSRIVVLSQREDMIDFANAYAPEHLIISMHNPWRVARDIIAAGSVFIGNYSCESAGDYASGTNHTLPTNGWAAAYSGVNIDSFMHKITYQELTREGMSLLAPTIITMAEAEGLDAHANAVKVRMEGGDE